MSKNIYIDVIGGNYIAALADGDKLLEYYIEHNDDSNVVGNIYKGKVVAVLGGMQAAFVNIGQKKNAYLNAGEFLPDRKDIADGVLPETLDVKEGSEILVQVVKDSSGSKGVKCSPHLSFAGTYLVYMPTFDMVGVSRKITDEKIRAKLGRIVEKSRKSGRGGFIVRTAAANVSSRHIKREMSELYGQFDAMIKRAEVSPAPSLVHEEADLVTRMLRDAYSSDVEKIYFSSPKMYEEIARRRGTEFGKKSVLYTKERDMFRYFGLDKEVDKLLRNRVELSSGAYIIIDKTEALTVIDVNTGKYTGTDSLEETVFRTNMLAAVEVARQVRLRNIGGIVVVDFIDMAEQEHRDMVVAALEDALKNDRSKCNVLGMSGLGLVEFTRKKKRNESTFNLVQECPYCKGDGLIYSNDYVVLKLRTALLDLFTDGYSAAIIDINADMADYILKNGALRRDVEKIWANKRIYIIPHRTYHLENFRVRGDNSKILDLPDKAKLLY